MPVASHSHEDLGHTQCWPSPNGGGIIPLTILIRSTLVSVTRVLGHHAANLFPLLPSIYFPPALVLLESFALFFSLDRRGGYVWAFPGYIQSFLALYLAFPLPIVDVYGPAQRALEAIQNGSGVQREGRVVDQQR